MITPTLEVEADLWAQGHVIASLDEVGRGSWAGPVTLCAYVLSPQAQLDQAPYSGVKDSKMLSLPKREALYLPLQEVALSFAFGSASNEEIDHYGMSRCLNLAAHRAIQGLSITPTMFLLDGPHDYIKHPTIPTKPIVKGDASCLSIGCSSVLAKVYRDHLMAEEATRYPEFDFAKNAGYPSPKHKAALKLHGPTPLHRTSWKFMDELGGRILRDTLF
jgi:ribonuclease HII